VFEDHTALVRVGPAQRQRTLDELRRLGADTLRVEVKWNEVAPAAPRRRRPAFDASDPGAYPGFGPYDDLVRRASAIRMRVVADLAPDAPRWATAGARGYAATANLRIDPIEFGRFAGAVARRYSGGYRGLPRVGWLSLWNEPNHSLFLKPLGRAPALYRAMVAAALPAVRANAPGTRVLVGELASSGREGTSTGPREFLRRWLCLDRGFRPVATGPCSSFQRVDADGFAQHPYGSVDRVPAGRDYVSVPVIRRLGRYLDAAAGAGRLPRDLPIYATEFGLQTNPPDPTVTTSPTSQAEELNRAEELSYRYPRLRSYAQYLLYDDPARDGPRQAPWSGFQTGLRFHDGRPKPAWTAYRLPIVVHRRGGGVRIWGRVRPGAGQRTVQLEVRQDGGFVPSGSAFRTDPFGFFEVRREGAGVYRFSAAGIGTSRVAAPGPEVTLARG